MSGDCPRIRPCGKLRGFRRPRLVVLEPPSHLAHSGRRTRNARPPRQNGEQTLALNSITPSALNFKIVPLFHANVQAKRKLWARQVRDIALERNDRARGSQEQSHHRRTTGENDGPVLECEPDTFPLSLVVSSDICPSHAKCPWISEM